MQLGVVFPQTEIGADPGAVRAFATAAEELGYDYILAFDHVVGVDRASRPGFTGPYDHTHAFHEPFVLFSYLAGLTRRIGFMTGILILPQRQTVLVAKQAAALDVLSGGRLRLGVGVGWNEAEYEALGVPFASRGKRYEEQVALLRELFTRDIVRFEGEYHTVRDAGLNPLPVQRPIPIWMGGASASSVVTGFEAGRPTPPEGPERLLKRVARLADGWLPQFSAGPHAAEQLERFRRLVRAAGRDPAMVGIDGRITMAQRPNDDDWAADLKIWRDLDATHVAIHTMQCGWSGADAHIAAIRRFRAVANAA